MPEMNKSRRFSSERPFEFSPTQCRPASPRTKSDQIGFSHVQWLTVGRRGLRNTRWDREHPPHLHSPTQLFFRDCFVSECSTSELWRFSTTYGMAAVVRVTFGCDYDHNLWSVGCGCSRCVFFEACNFGFTAVLACLGSIGAVTEWA